ncbi:MucB/RseB C-terminal domain-containing protein [Pseudomonas sp. 2FE]|uniref:MucB/RseB C-terminal domain-containing protein n=1 Tax=Pseudomonas sp. 2FE TaxID=2502190 RepID=UPI0010F43A5E|nr:MucB/RseB C-terminal domain-containing protein [Pseudomonas sp. 2FE]
MRAIPFSLLLGSWLALPVQAADAQDWLNRLAEAEQRQNFQGTFVYERNGSFSTHSIWHRVDSTGDGEVRERLLQLDGPVQEVLRVNGRTQCVSGALADQVSDGQSWPARALDPKQLAAWYDLRILGESRVAGRAAVVVAVLPRDQHRYGFELHLDRETGLPLKSLLLNEKGQLLERFQFSSLDTTAPLDDALQPSANCQPVHFAEAQAIEPNAWRSEWLPPGFNLNSVLERRSPASAEPVACLMYGDGLARFSVFLEPLHGAAVEDARSQLGPTVAVSKRMSTVDGDVMVTVVGEIPLGTAERVALSMRAGAAQATP